MSTEEDAYRAKLAEEGVELPAEESKGEDEAKAKADADTKTQEDEAKKKAVEDAAAKAEADKAKEPLQDANGDRKPRTIYDDYKEKKSEWKTEKERADKAEGEAKDWKDKFDALSTAKTPEKKEEAKDDLEEFAKEIEANPEQLKRMRELFLKDFKGQEVSPELLKGLEEWRADKAERAKVAEATRFESEFQSLVPSIKADFPQITDVELAAVKKQIDTLAHTAGWNDKELDYILFKHKETLKDFVSPKKKGMESKQRQDGEQTDGDIDFSAYPANGTAAEIAAWEKAYKSAGKSDGLMTDAQGRKTI